MELDGRDEILFLLIHEHDPSNPSVPSLFATPKRAGFKMHSFFRNDDAYHLPDVRCVRCGQSGLPTYAQIGAFANANAQRRPRESFGF